MQVGLLIRLMFISLPFCIRILGIITSFLLSSLIQAIGKHCRYLQSIVLSQCGSLSSKGIASLAGKCRKLKMLDIAMTKVKNRSRKLVTKVYSPFYVSLVRLFLLMPSFEMHFCISPCKGLLLVIPKLGQ